MKPTTSIILFLFLISNYAFAQTTPPFYRYLNDRWVDSLMNKLSLDQKIGQLFMVQAYSNKTDVIPLELMKMIRQYEVGAVIFMQGGPMVQAKMTNQLQLSSKVPLLVAIDGETGLGFRLDSTIGYPVQLALGAIHDDSLIYRMGYEIGEQFRRIGVHMNMAPVSDVNVNPENPIISFRSFGGNKMQVARKSWLLAHGMQDAGVVATAKHFPGHGDTRDDSHTSLPVIEHPVIRLDSLEIYPFKYLIDNGISAVMTAHLQVPVLEPDRKIPATLSGNIIRKKLKTELDFKGLVITDAMNMKGVSNLYSSAESTVKALNAGNDMVEIVPRVDKAVEAIRLAVAKGELSVADIDEKCRKILAVKKWLGLDKQRLVDCKNLNEDINKEQYRLTKRLLLEQALTVLTNQNNILPLLRLDTLKLACLSIGSEKTTPFQKMLGNYTQIDNFNIGKTPAEAEIEVLISQLSAYNLLIVGIHGINLYPNKRFGISDQQINLIEKLSDRNKIVCYFGNPYSMAIFPGLTTNSSLILAYQDEPDTEEMTAQLIFGATSAKGKLPVAINDQFPIYSGIDLRSENRLKYTMPEEVGISSVFLKAGIDSLANLGLSMKAFPGCQVLIAKNGKIILRSSYGFTDYEKLQPVENESLYDIASITKVSASLLAVMKLYEEKKIDLDDPFSDYFIEFKHSNKSEFSVRDVLTHQARLQSGIPFWLEPGSRTKIREGAFRDQPSDEFKTRISSGMYVRSDFTAQIIKDIVRSPLRTNKEYLYSDLGFGMLPFVTERLTGIPFQDYLNREFYSSLGARYTVFKPYEKFPLRQIVPTENDQTFRKEVLQGFVHDELAALMGGVSGNAGLFSTANDLAKIFQMLLQSGYYGRVQYFKPHTVGEFTKVQFPLSANRRALGFDKPNPGIPGQKNKFPAAGTSPASYGHTGFTGTFVWADPENQLLFIFLSNRVHPDRKNSLLTDLNIRTSMHQIIYEAIKRGVVNY